MARWVLHLGVLLMVLQAPTFAQQPDWVAISDAVTPSVLPLESKTGHCSAWVINPAERYVLSDDHCHDEEMFVDGSPAKVVHRDRKRDLMVLQVDRMDGHPGLKLAAKNPKRGLPAAATGWGYGYNECMFRPGWISNEKVIVPDERFALGGPYASVGAAFVGGMSGAPVVNAAGEVVMIVQFGSDRVGFGVPVEEIQQRVGKYFSK
jgi:S1-C subfamily serine protease